MKNQTAKSTIATHLKDVFEVKELQFVDLRDQENVSNVRIVQARDYPAESMITLCTIGVSDSPLYQEDGTEYLGTRVEFIASCDSGQEIDLARVLRRAGDFVTHVKGFAHPGMFLCNLIGQFRISTSVPHGLLTTPFAYAGLGAINDFNGRKVSWLQIIPVSSNEITYATDVSVEALEEIFEKEEITWESFDRPSCI